MKYLHQVSYLRLKTLQNIIGVCLSYSTAIYSVQRVCLSQSNTLLSVRYVYTIYHIIVTVVYQSLYLSRMNSQRGRWVCWKSKNTCSKSRLIRNTYTKFDTKYLHQVSYLLDACFHHTAVYPVPSMCLSQCNISLHHCCCCLLGILSVSQLCAS